MDRFNKIIDSDQQKYQPVWGRRVVVCEAMREAYNLALNDVLKGLVGDSENFKSHILSLKIEDVPVEVVGRSVMEFDGRVDA